MLVSKSSHRFWLTSLATISLLAQCFWLPNVSTAQTVNQQAGQVTSAKSVTINGTNVTAGQTVFDESKIVVGDQGLGKFSQGALGRFEIGGNSEYVFNTENQTIAGELILGCMQINANPGSKLNIKTAYGVITANGQQATNITLGIKDRMLHIIVDSGDVTVTSAGKSAMVKTGNYITVENKGGEPTFSDSKSASGCRNSGVVSCTCSPSALVKQDDKAKSKSGKGSNSGKGGYKAGGLWGGLSGAAAAAATLAFTRTNGNSNNDIIVNGFRFRCIGGNCTLVSPTTP